MICSLLLSVLLFLSAPHLRDCFCFGGFWDRLGFCCDLFTFPKGLRPLDSHNGASRPLDPSAKLARLATASIDTRFSFVWERNKQGSCRRQLLGNSAKPTFHAPLEHALFLNSRYSFECTITFAPRLLLYLEILLFTMPNFSPNISTLNH